MRNKSAITLSFATAFFCLSLPTFALNAKPAPQAAPAPIRGEHQAMRMVPASVTLDTTLDANKVAVGYQFKATLDHKVQLQNGPMLPGGTKLIGRVAADDLNIAGKSKIALRFTQAILKNGTTVPIKATIVAAYQPGSEDYSETTSGIATPIPNNWNDGTLAVDQIGGLGKDVDLHSRIASHNSGVFVAHDNHIVKLPASSEFSLALSARPQATASIQ